MAFALRVGTIGRQRTGGAWEQTMAGDADWVDDVRRWCLAGHGVEGGYAAGPANDPAGDGSDAIGYEAAVPALQSRHWPDAPPSTAVTAV